MSIIIIAIVITVIAAFVVRSMTPQYRKANQLSAEYKDDTKFSINPALVLLSKAQKKMSLFHDRSVSTLVVTKDANIEIVSIAFHADNSYNTFINGESLGVTGKHVAKANQWTEKTMLKEITKIVKQRGGVESARIGNYGQPT